MSCERSLLEIQKEIDNVREFLNRIVIDIDTENIDKKNEILFISEKMDNLLIEYFNFTTK